MRRAAALLLGLAGFTATAGAADDAALRIVEACRAKLDARSDIGIERIQKRCPELLPAIDAAPWRELVPRSLRERREELSAQSLAALVELVRQSRAAPGPAAGPDTARLAPILQELGVHGQEGATRWERFKRWLKDLRNPDKTDDREGFLARWSRELSTSEGIARALSYVGYGLLGGLVLFVVWSELRAAGLFAARRRATAAAADATWRRRVVLADVATAPLAERPGLLLRLLGEALTRAHRLPAADGLTAGAIARRAQLDSDDDRAGLAHVARTADEVRYADRVPPEPALEQAVERAQTLLTKLTRAKGRG
ncbi:MAG TPA: DUF4129 domain-containing protein [Steroidobacteraceae bacterium]|nr:DUF4129 domain-containing protein [Steroidobacteraceae bacterium]